MPRAHEHCAKPLNHQGPCLTEDALRKQLDNAAAYHTERRRVRYAKLNAYKLAAGCADCGYAEEACALDFDHRDPSLKRANIAAMMTMSWAKIQEELDKCDLRCANCHRIRTMVQQRRRPDPSIEAETGPLP